MSLTAYAFIAFLMAPVWFPIVRVVLSFFQPRKRWVLAAYVWYYIVAFVWAVGGVAYQWEIQVPSGIGYFFVLLIGWFILVSGMSLDPLLKKKNKASENV
ncbi:MAG: hypothetical protein Q8K52_01080 [Thiobacillus sp.]|nr:hypothetical protein [Thiobacillus sp.]